MITFKISIQHSKPAGEYWGTDTELVVDHIGTKCTQMSVMGNFGAGSEDCLFLNVYVPEVSNIIRIVFIIFIIATIIIHGILHIKH